MHSFYLAPEQLELLVVTGPDAARFLQGQLTCDVDALLPDTFTWGAACNNKGRVFASFLIVRHADAFHLVFTRGLGSVFVANLKKYLPFYKCTLALAPESPLCLGAAGPDAAAVLERHFGDLPPERACKPHGEGWICTLGADRRQYLLCLPPVPHAAVLSGLAAAMAPASLDAWLALDMQHGRFPLAPADAERYTPQELHFDRNGFVSFSKGCYTGQEIVARMHYRGKLKKQLYLLSTSAAAGPDEFDVIDASGAVLGRTIAQAKAADGTVFALAPLPVDLAEAQRPLRTPAGETLDSSAF